MINWKVRIKNERFWLSIIPAVLVFIETVFAVFGVVIDLGDIGQKILAVVQSLFMILAIAGIINDPTTSGYKDSQLAMTYEIPKVDPVEEKEEAVG